jgi:hypothetical protein
MDGIKPPPRVSDEDRPLVPLAQEARVAYIMAYRGHVMAMTGVPSEFGSRLVPRWDGGVASDGKTYKPIWFAVVRAALAAGVSVVDLIGAAFDSWTSPQPPWPTHLLGAEIAARAAENRGESERRVRDALEIQVENFDTEISVLCRRQRCTSEEAAHRALMDPLLELSAVFRYCAAVAAGDEVVAGQWRDLAFRQYVFHTAAYDTTWGDLIPREMRERASRIREGQADAV